MKKQDTQYRIQLSKRNFAIKLGLILYICIFISIEIGKDSFQKHSLQFPIEALKFNFLENQPIDEEVFKVATSNNFDFRNNNVFNNNTRHFNLSDIFIEMPIVKTFNFNKSLRKSIDNQQVDNQSNRFIQKGDIESFIETNSDQMELKIDRQLTQNYELPLQSKTQNELVNSGMSITQQGNYNLAVQVNVRGIGQIQNIQQIGNYNNNPEVTRTNLRNFSVDNSLAYMAKPILLSSILTNDGKEIQNLPISQYANQKYGKAIMKVLGNENIAFQYQEGNDKQNVGMNEAILTIVGNKNDVIQSQIGIRNSSKLYVSGNENILTNCQSGELNYAGIAINSGLNNDINVEQSGVDNFVIVQQSGERNTVKIIQN